MRKLTMRLVALTLQANLCHLSVAEVACLVNRRHLGIELDVDLRSLIEWKNSMSNLLLRDPARTWHSPLMTHTLSE
jgi:hypothetical protein